MLRDYKYKPMQLRRYCPVCEGAISDVEWADFGMHLICTEYYQSGRYLVEAKNAKRNMEFQTKT